MSQRVPGAVQPWLLLGERRRRSLEQRIRAAGEAWAAHWVSGTVTVAVAVEPASQSSTRESGDRKSLRFAVRERSGEWLAELIVPHCLAAWAAGLGTVALSAIADFDDMSPFGEIELELVNGFWNMLVAQAQAPAVEASLERVDEQPGERQPAIAKRGVRAVCTFGSAPELCIQSTLSPRMAAALLAERRVAVGGEKLNSRRSAVAPAPVDLDCCLGTVLVPVRDLHSLRSGDVLVTDMVLNGHAELRVRSKSHPIAAGTLGEVGGRKAIRVETARVGMANQGLLA